ncbi:formate dehydrogenase subunit gamma [soil metagenome]
MSTATFAPERALPPGPPPPRLSPGHAAIVQDVLTSRVSEPGALLPILHDVQDAIGYVPPEAVPEIASALNLSRAEVHGVVTYYHHFRAEPAARHVVQICRAEACQAMGAQALFAHARTRLRCDSHGTSADGAFTLEAAYCLGLCASSPSMTLGDELHARVTPQAFDALIAEARSAE